jgi:hypothetical protein
MEQQQQQHAIQTHSELGAWLQCTGDVGHQVIKCDKLQA